MELLSAFVGVPEVNRVYNVDALTLLRAMPSASVGLIAVDPPYNGVKDEAWDNQWATDADFIEWLRAHLVEFRRVLKPNGSLYLFASPRMAARVEVLTGEYFNVLNNIRWVKDAGWHNKTSKEEIRSYLEPWEAAIFAEQYGSDEHAAGEAGFVAAEEALKRRIFGDYLRAEFGRAGVNNRQVAALFPSITGGLTGCVSNWLLGLNVPTPDQYQTMRDYLNRASVGEFLRTEYEELRTEYEELRRPFNVSEFVPYTDVWDFATVNTYPGKHPCEKPAAMMQHIINASSRAGDLVLDCFAGSGATLAAAYQLGRNYIGCDMDANWVEVARNRCVKEFGARRRSAVTVLDDLPLFAQVGA
jgi:adenine-specific DNA-methyltransferase